MTASPVLAEPGSTRSHREVLTALSGLIMGMFVAVLSGTVVSTSLPRIISDLGGDQAAYTWVITASLLATAVSTPIWGKLADLVDRKMLLQLALGLFVVGTAVAGFSQDTTMLIGVRVIQGIGAGGLMSLVMVAVALIISPRERGRYMGLVGGVMALATIGGPLLGGVVTDAFGWRANFFLGIPFAIAAIIIIQRTLHLPKSARTRVKIDYVGAVLLAVGVSLLLVWVSMGGSQFDWDSVTSYVVIGVAAAALIAFVVTEFLVEEPIVPMSLFANRTFTLAVIASIAVGVAMFATSVFLAQYFQLARGASPTESGLMTIPMVVGQMVASIGVGALVSRFGRWKGWMLLGSALLVAGVSLMSTLRYDTDFVWVSAYMVVLGAGLGMVMQNLTLVVQNDTPASQLGAASSNVNFFRSIAGTIGVTVMGSVLATQVTSHVTSGLASFTPGSRAEVDALQGLAGGGVPKVAELPEAIRVIVESAYGHGIADVFLIAIPLAVLSFLAIAFLPNRPLSRQTAAEKLEEEVEQVAIDLAEAEIGAPVTSSIELVEAPGPETRDGDRPDAGEREAVASGGRR